MANLDAITGQSGRLQTSARRQHPLQNASKGGYRASPTARWAVHPGNVGLSDATW